MSALIYSWWACVIPRESVAEEATLPLCEWLSDKSGGKLQSSSISYLKHNVTKSRQSQYIRKSLKKLGFCVKCKLKQNKTICKSHICQMEDSSSSTIQDCLWQIHFFKLLLFMVHQMYSIGEKSRLQGGQFSTRILLLQSNEWMQYEVYCLY